MIITVERLKRPERDGYETQPLCILKTFKKSSIKTTSLLPNKLPVVIYTLGCQLQDYLD